jgi:hypothetical protein
MRSFKTRQLGTITLLLVRQLDECIARCKSMPHAKCPRGTEPSGHMKKVLDRIEKAEKACRDAGLSDACQQVGHASGHLRWQTNDLDYSGICAELRHVINAIVLAIDSRTFLEVASEFSGYIDNELSFGQLVIDAFPDAKNDIRDAGNCLATECSTAAVFHLMRVAEHGLRALAHDRRIVLPKAKPIDLATWEDLLKELEKAEDAIRNFPKTSAREAQFEFFHGAMMELKRFKNKFRNRVMHARDSYDMNEAKSAFDHVKEFMHLLSTHISENKRTPVVWKGTKWINSPTSTKQ